MKPQDVAKQNIETYMKQLEMFGTTYDWSRSVNTADPKYFKRTQRVFLQFYNHYYDELEKKAKPIEELKLKIENGKLKINEDIEKYLNKQRLAYVDYKPINRCPKCMT
jgi:leucyl-tRNA synthetase